MRHATIILIVLILPVLTSAATLKVPSQYPTIQDAIDAASKGDTVLVAPGTYVENIDFKGKGITVMSEQGAAVTVIDGNYAGSVVTCKSGEGPDSVLDGFTITNGWAWGGGMCNIGSNPKITNCIFSKNFTDYWPYLFPGLGGGMFNSSSSPTVTKCTFAENEAEGLGGGMCNLDSNPIVTDCTFSKNLAGYTFFSSVGGGMYNDNSSPTVTNCTFSGNGADSGGGMCNESSSPTVTNCSFIGNVAIGYGGGIYSGFSSTIIKNSTITENTANSSFGGGGVYVWLGKPTITNSILWENHGGELIIDGGNVTISYCDVMGGWPGTGNIDSDPLFVDPVNNDFHLTFNSPCRGSGDNSAVTELYDFEGDPRIAYGTVDMGADEFYTHLYWSGDATPGGNVEIKFVGLPGTSPVGLCIGTGVLDPPLKSMWGDWYLKFPIMGPIGMPSIPSTGVLIIPGNIPGSPPPPYSIPMQALIGGELSNLSVLEVK